MADPFEALRLPVTPAEPDPGFATRLRARLERALSLPRGVSMSTATLDQQTTRSAPTLGAAIPYLAVHDAQRAIQWYADVFGAEIVGEPMVMPDGRVGHCELSLAGGTMYLADEHPEIGVVAPDPAVCAVSLMLSVADADATRAAVLANGGHSHRDPYDGYGQRNAWVIDPFGHRWGLTSPVREETTRSVRHGDTIYVSVWAAEPARAATFYSAVLGWRFEPNDYGRYDVADSQPQLSISGEPDGLGLFRCYAVSDLDAAVDRVRAAGGTATEVEQRPYGRISDCTDDQGSPFALTDVPADVAGRPSVSGSTLGHLAYITLEFPDSRRFRDFYGAVLNWEFTPGSVDDGWQVVDTEPMTGLAGGSERPNAVPMWRVDDISAALQRVRDAGGTATDAQQQPYGLMSECTDDQGTRFFLGQL